MGYLKKLYGSVSVIVGAIFVSEHIWSWGEFTFFDFWGHEWLGVILILFGIGLNINFKKQK